MARRFSILRRAPGRRMTRRRGGCRKRVAQEAVAHFHAMTSSRIPAYVIGFGKCSFASYGAPRRRARSSRSTPMKRQREKSIRVRDECASGSTAPNPRVFAVIASDNAELFLSSANKNRWHDLENFSLLRLVVFAKLKIVTRRISVSAILGASARDSAG